MNPAVMGYSALFVLASALSAVGFLELRLCKKRDCGRNPKPAVISSMLCAAWALLSANGVWVKWLNPHAKLTVESTVFMILVAATLMALMYVVRCHYRARCTLSRHPDYVRVRK